MSQEENNVEAVKQLIGEHLPHDVAEANARRIVACLEAMNDTEAIEVFGVSSVIVKAVVRQWVKSAHCFGRLPIAQWMPISQAPKDAVILLGYEAHPRMDRLVYEGCWNATQETWTSVNGFILHSDATHWQPMPRAPKPAHSGIKVFTIGGDIDVDRIKEQLRNHELVTSSAALIQSKE